MKDNTVCQKQTLYNSPMTHISPSLLSPPLFPQWHICTLKDRQYDILICIFSVKTMCMVYFVQEGRRQLGQLPVLPWHMEAGTENLQREGKSETSLQALFPRLGKLMRCPLPSRGGLSPRMSPTQTRSAMQCGVSCWGGGHTASWDPVTQEKQEIPERIRDMPVVRNRSAANTQWLQNQGQLEGIVHYLLHRTGEKNSSARTQREWLVFKAFYFNVIYLQFFLFHEILVPVY